MTVPSNYVPAYNEAWKMLNDFDGLEPRSALKQAASDNGIAEGDEMRQFVTWAERILFA
jgi:hypothetical protein